MTLPKVSVVISNTRLTPYNTTNDTINITVKVFNGYKLVSNEIINTSIYINYPVNDTLLINGNYKNNSIISIATNQSNISTCLCYAIIFYGGSNYISNTIRLNFIHTESIAPINPITEILWSNSYSSSFSLNKFYHDGNYLYSVYNQSNDYYIQVYNDETLLPIDNNFNTIETYYTFSIGGSGSYIYNFDTNSIQAYSFNGTNLNKVGNLFTVSGVLNCVCGGVINNYIILVTNTYIKSYTFDGVNYTETASLSLSFGLFTRYSIFLHNGYLVVITNDSYMKVFSFNGSSFTQIVSLSDGGGGSFRGGCSDGNYIYLLSGSYIKSYTFNGSSFSFISNYSGLTFSNISSIDYCSGYLFASSYSSTTGFDGIKMLTFDGSNFNEYYSISTTQRLYEMIYKNNYLYVSSYPDSRIGKYLVTY